MKIAVFKHKLKSGICKDCLRRQALTQLRAVVFNLGITTPMGVVCLFLG